MVPKVSDLIRAHGRDGAGTGSAHPLQLHLAWVQVYGPELDKRCRAHLKRTNKSDRVDETYIRIKGQDRYLYRAVDSTRRTIDFLLTAKRDAGAAKRFFLKTLLDPANPQPRVINVDRLENAPVPALG
jgi:transposase-like protein